MIPSLILWLIDRSIRLLRSGLLHYNFIESGKRGFKAAEASVQLFQDPQNGDVVRLDFDHPQKPWSIGQHFYLCFTEGSIWQSHPMTPFSYPESVDGTVKHSYLFRAKKGETKKIAQIISNKSKDSSKSVTTGVILTGPYGEDLSKEIRSDNNLFFAGGSGITFVLPIIFHLIRTRPSTLPNVELVWVIRREQDVSWISSELEQIKNSGVTVKIYVTREPISSSSSSTPTHERDLSEIEPTSSTEKVNASSTLSIKHTREESRHPNLELLTKDFVEDTSSGSITVFASGPGGMISDLRKIVATHNDGRKVWKGDQKFDVKLLTDNRLE